MYKIKNISRFLMLTGLYPGESKNVSELDSSLLELYHKQLISVTKVKEQPVIRKKKLEEKDEETLNSTGIEVMNTDGRN